MKSVSRFLIVLFISACSTQLVGQQVPTQAIPQTNQEFGAPVESLPGLKSVLVQETAGSDVATSTIPTTDFSAIQLPSQLPNQRPGLNVGGENGIQFGGGEGYRIGPKQAGIQYGGGQGVRFGTPNAGVQYGNGEGVRFGTRNIGVQYGGGQILRWGTPNAGVKIGGGEGFRIGTQRHGIQFGTGRGLQIGRIHQ